MLGVSRECILGRGVQAPRAGQFCLDEAEGVVRTDVTGREAGTDGLRETVPLPTPAPRRAGLAQSSAFGAACTPSGLALRPVSFPHRSAGREERQTICLKVLLPSHTECS